MTQLPEVGTSPRIDQAWDVGFTVFCTIAGTVSQSFSSSSQGLGRRYVSPAWSNQVATSPRYQFELAPAAMGGCHAGKQHLFFEAVVCPLESRGIFAKAKRNLDNSFASGQGSLLQLSRWR